MAIVDRPITVKEVPFIPANLEPSEIHLLIPDGFDEEIEWERDGNTAEGGELFRTNCAMCHNFAGQGGALTQGKYAPTLMGVEPKHIYEAMITGPQAMPVFSDKTITPEEKLSIIKWIKAAEKEPNLGGASLGRVGPVTEGLLIWTFGLGLLIGIAVWLAAKARQE